MDKGISTPARWIYLNLYSCLLLFLGAGIMFLGVWLVGSLLFLGLALILGGLFLLRIGGRMILSWGDKKRKYAVLMERNRAELRPDTFSEYVGAPCGRLLTRLVLKDLGISERWPEVASQRKPLAARFKEACRPEVTRVRIHR